MLQISAIFFKIGLFAFGGGYVILTFLQEEAVERGWMSAHQFIDFIAIAQSTPGPIAINIATLAGFQAGGIPGAVVASGSVALPGMIISLLFARFFFHVYETPVIQAILRGVRPVVAGMVAGVVWQIGRIALCNVPTVLIAAVVLLLLLKWRIHPLWLILGSAMAGVLFF